MKTQKCILQIVIAAVLLTPFAAVAARGSSSSSDTKGGFLIEPYLGYYFGSWKCSDTNNCSAPTSEPYSGVVYGGRVGYEYMNFIFGADYMGGSWSASYSNSGLSFSDTYDPTNLGVFVGYDMPILLRFYGEYIVSASLDDTSKNPLSTTSGTLTGSGIKLGVGFKVLPFLVINAEYLQNSYDKSKQNSLTTNFSPATTYSSYGVSVSLPLVL
jgi:hypothetical protein